MCQYDGSLRFGVHLSESHWIEIIVTASVPLAEGVAVELVEQVAAASGGVQIRKSEVVFWVDRPDVSSTLVDVRACLQGLQDKGWAVDPSRVAAGQEAPEEEWRDAWKTHFHVTRLTRQIVVVPSWESFEPLATDIPIHLDPGQAFGTGAHASTQLVLETMQELADQKGYSPATVFDLGTGSGILAIAAAKFWPTCQVVATDIDANSMVATKENSKQNQVDSQIQVSTTDLSAIQPQFPLVLANIQAHILRTLRDDLLARLLPGSDLLLSGILESQIQPLVDFFLEPGDLELVAIRNSALNPDWSSAHFRKP